MYGHVDNKDSDNRQQFPRTVKYHNVKYIAAEPPKLMDFEMVHQWVHILIWLSIRRHKYDSVTPPTLLL